MAILKSIFNHFAMDLFQAKRPKVQSFWLFKAVLISVEIDRFLILAGHDHEFLFMKMNSTISSPPNLLE